MFHCLDFFFSYGRASLGVGQLWVPSAGDLLPPIPAMGQIWRRCKWWCEQKCSEATNHRPEQENQENEKGIEANTVWCLHHIRIISLHFLMEVPSLFIPPALVPSFCFQGTHFCYGDFPGWSHEGIKVLASKMSEQLLRCPSASMG